MGIFFGDPIKKLKKQLQEIRETPLFKQLGDYSSFLAKVRRTSELIEKLEKSRDPSLVDVLCDTLSIDSADYPNELILHIIQTLGRLNDRKAVPALKLWRSGPARFHGGLLGQAWREAGEMLFRFGEPDEEEKERRRRLKEEEKLRRKMQRSPEYKILMSWQHLYPLREALLALSEISDSEIAEMSHGEYDDGSPRYVFHQSTPRLSLEEAVAQVKQFSEGAPVLHITYALAGRFHSFSSPDLERRETTPRVWLSLEEVSSRMIKLSKFKELKDGSIYSKCFVVRIANGYLVGTIPWLRRGWT